MELWLGMDKPGFILPAEFYPIHTERLRWVIKEIKVTMVLLLPEFSDSSVCDTEGIPPSRLELSTQSFQPDVQVCDLKNLMGTGEGKEPPSALVPAVSSVWMCWVCF